MNVKTLIEILSREDPEQEVYFAYDSHDYWGTVLASKITDVEEKDIQYTSYHECFSVPKQKETYSDNEEDQKTVILLS